MGELGEDAGCEDGVGASGEAVFALAGEDEGEVAGGEGVSHPVSFLAYEVDEDETEGGGEAASVGAPLGDRKVHVFERVVHGKR